MEEDKPTICDRPRPRVSRRSSRGSAAEWILPALLHRAAHHEFSLFVLTMRCRFGPGGAAFLLRPRPGRPCSPTMSPISSASPSAPSSVLGLSRVRLLRRGSRTAPSASASETNKREHRGLSAPVPAVRSSARRGRAPERAPGRCPGGDPPLGMRGASSAGILLPPVAHLDDDRRATSAGVDRGGFPGRGRGSSRRGWRRIWVRAARLIWTRSPRWPATRTLLRRALAKAGCHSRCSVAGPGVQGDDAAAMRRGYCRGHPPTPLSRSTWAIQVICASSRTTTGSSVRAVSSGAAAAASGVRNWWLALEAGAPAQR